jgi:glutaredoxin
MKIIRWFLGALILVLDRVFSPKGVERTHADQAALEVRLAGIDLYQFEACPFCVKVRRYLKREGISLPLRDATKEPYRSELISGGGKLQVPCLKISQAGEAPRWLYESNDVIDYLRSKIQDRQFQNGL